MLESGRLSVVPTNLYASFMPNFERQFWASGLVECKIRLKLELIWREPGEK